jgi:hypothetical protein
MRSLVDARIFTLLGEIDVLYQRRRSVRNELTLPPQGSESRLLTLPTLANLSSTLAQIMSISETIFMKTTNLRGSWERKGRILAVTLCGCALALAGARSAKAQTQTSSEGVNQQELSAHSYQEHHYASPAERAEDALLIVKVKAAIADAGFADNDPLTVDADHGRVTLAGVLESRQDMDRAVAVVAEIDGVTGINNRLTRQKSP